MVKIMMNTLYIVWQEDSNLHIPIIDEQHRAIVATINSLFYFIQEGWGVGALRPTLAMIKSNSMFHFKTEEGLLEKVGYPDLKKHAELQKKFLIDIDAAARESIEFQDPTLLLKFLKNWWLHHLRSEHQLYTPYLKRIK
jgi:hemerythrin